jgi:hypothetical protein
MLFPEPAGARSARDGMAVIARGFKHRVACSPKTAPAFSALPPSMAVVRAHRHSCASTCHRQTLRGYGAARFKYDIKTNKGWRMEYAQWIN